MIWDIVIPIAALLLAGLAARKLELLNQTRVDILNKVAFYVALPALVFNSTYSRSLSEIFSIRLVMGFLAVIFLVSFLAWALNYRDSDVTKKSVSIVQSYHSNFGYMGLPIVAMALGGAAEGKASVLLGFGSMIQILLTTSVLVYLNRGKELGVFERLKRIVVNPVVMALLLGLAFSYFGFSAPSGLGEAVSVGEEVISLVSKSALPIALLGVGASINLEGIAGKARTLASVPLLKLIVMPGLGSLIFWILGVDELGLKAGTLMLAMPTAVSTFIYSNELGGDEELASLNISLTTLLSIVTISILLFLMG